jgi:pyridoxine 4-dehydrogenase
VPLSVTFGLIEDESIKTGKIRGIALSEPMAETIVEATRHSTVLGVEVELSM